MFVLFLLLTLFVLFYVIAGGTLPEVDLDQAKNNIAYLLVPLGSGIGIFLLAWFFLKTPLAGLPWGVLGWFLPQWIYEIFQSNRRNKLKATAKDFVTSSAGLFSAGQVTPKVISTIAERSSEPIRTELKEMLAQSKTNPLVSFSRMFKNIGRKYGLSEFDAVAEILAASQRAGGPRAAAGGLKRLGLALRQRDRLLTERKKALIEVKIAGIVVIALLVAGLLLDITMFRDMFMQSSGKVVLGVSSVIIVGLIFMTKKTSQSSDLA
mgnify:CR=1 FL=1